MQEIKIYQLIATGIKTQTKLNFSL